MARESVASAAPPRAERAPPHSEEAETGVLGSILLDAERVMDLCLEAQLDAEAFYLPAHRAIYETCQDMAREGAKIDLLTVVDRLKATGRIEAVGGSTFVDRLVDSTPTAAHAEYYIDLVRQKYLLRSIIECARRAEGACFESDEHADLVLSRVEQSFLDITERQHGVMTPWREAVQRTMEHVEQILALRRGLTGLSTGFLNLDEVFQGLRRGEMIVLAARPSMGKTSLAMNIAEAVALGRREPDQTPHPVGIFSLEMSQEQLVLRMLCAHARVSAHQLTSGYASMQRDHPKLMQAASVLAKAPVYLDDTGGLDVLELRARARRMKKKFGVELIVIDYLQLLHSRETARQGRQVETADISGNLKAMAKELNVPVLVLSQLSRAPDQRGDKQGKPKLSDLRDSGAIEQDADVVCMLRRPCKYDDDPEHDDETLAIVDVAKNRNGPTRDDVRLNFEPEYMRFTDRVQTPPGAPGAPASEAERGPA